VTETAVANLVNLQDFDREFRQVLPKINVFNEAINKNLRSNVWSRKQVEDLTQLQYAITGLVYALTHLVNANRDGRG
jgi:hypothetical protein